MPANVDWTATENREIVKTGFELRRNPTQSKTDTRRRVAPLLDGRSDKSIEFKLANVSHAMELLGLDGIPGYQARDHIQLSLVPETRRQAVSLGLLPNETLDFDVMAIYVGEAGLANLRRGLATRTWGFPKWDDTFRLQPKIGLVVLASNSSGSGPRIPLEDWERGTVDLTVCRFMGPFVEAQAPHWEDELAGNEVKYPLRFGIEPIATSTGVSLAATGPLGEVSDAIRRSGTNAGMGKLVVRSNLDLGISTTPGTVLNTSTEPMTDDLPETGQRRRRGLGRLTDAAMRSAVELRAMKVTLDHYDSAGWSLNDTSSNNPWDYEAQKAGVTMRIEVKGTTGAGTHVQLTAGEVRNAADFSKNALAIVSDIRLDTSGPEPTASGGVLRTVEPWVIDPADLRPLTYEYRAPQ